MKNSNFPLMLFENNIVRHFARPQTSFKSGGKFPGKIITTRPYKAGGRFDSDSQKTLLSLFDYSGTWAKPFADAGWIIHQWDIKLSEFMDINLIEDAETALELFEDVTGIIAAPPCTDFSSSGAHVWKFKDEDGRTHKSVELVKQVMRLVNLFAPTDPEYDEPFFWAIENPVGRMGELTGLGKPWYFQPCEFAGYVKHKRSEILELDRIREKSLTEKITREEGNFVMEMEAYTKKTGIWGAFGIPEKKPIEPVYVTSSKGERFSPVAWFTGGKSAKTKELRSNTPLGFAMAFYEANKNYRAQFQPGYWEEQGWSDKEAKKIYKDYNRTEPGEQKKLFRKGGAMDNKRTFKLIDKYPISELLPSASAIECVNGKLYIAGDDSPNLLIVDSDLRNEKFVRLFPGEGRIPKSEKEDIEASAIINYGNLRTPDYRLLLTGSASLPKREIVIDVPINAPEKFVKYPAHEFFERVRRVIGHEINIEGMTNTAGFCILLACRGNQMNPQNYLIATNKNFYKNQAKADILRIKFNLPLSEMGLSGLCYIPMQNILLFTVSVEDSPDAIRDGVIGESYLGWVENITDKVGLHEIYPDRLFPLSEIYEEFEGEKIESICAESKLEDGRFVVHLVSDNDNGVSNIFKAIIDFS